MSTNARDREDQEYLEQNALAARALGSTHFTHLDQAVGRWNYIRIANEIAADLPSGTLLDWGCGFGQMTYLLRRRGFHVTPFDVATQDTPLPDVPMCRELGIVRSAHPTNLPFESGAFDAVLSCGVLEHVDEFSQPGNEVKSLAEIRRVLRPGGAFVIYQLPQRFAWQEAIVRRLGLGYAHPRRYSEREIHRLLQESGYEVARVRRNNLLPKNLTGVPEQLRTLYSRAARPLVMGDALLSRIPGLNRLAGVLELLAFRGR